MIFSRVMAWLYGIGAAIALVLGAWLYGKGRKDAEVKQVRRRVEAMRDAKETRYEVQDSDDARLVDILTGRVRD